MQSHFSIIALQETWFDSSILDIEIIKNTNYSIHRQDRSDTSHPKVLGGGVATIIKNEYQTKRHTFANITLLQYLCLEIQIESKIAFVINIYVPFGHSVESNEQFHILLTILRTFNMDDLIILGDFNMPHITWLPDENLPGVFLPNGTINDEFFINTCFDSDLRQIVKNPVGRNHLDLAFVTDELSCHCTYPIQEEFIDRASLRHHPFVINYQLNELEKEHSITLNYGRTNLNRSRKDMSRIQFEIASDEDALLEQWNGDKWATSKINRNIGRFQQVTRKNTPVAKLSRNWLSSHPWLKRSSNYARSRDFKINARKNFMLDPSDENRLAYKNACVQNSNVFEAERTIYLSKVMDDTKRNTMEFFKLMKSGSKPKRETPEIMISDGTYVKGIRKTEAFAKHLSSCFLSNPPSLGDSLDDIAARYLSDPLFCAKITLMG